MKSWPARAYPNLPGRAPIPAVFDTRTQQIDQLPQEERASLYVCGITPYDATHMGHAATYVAFDLLHRAWLDAGVPVDYVQNVTDVDDPLLERANRDGVDWRALAADQTDLFRADMTALNVLPPAHYIGATESVEWIVPTIEQLMTRGVAYRVAGHGSEPDGDVYFDVTAAAALHRDEEQHTTELQGWELGTLSGFSREDMLRLSEERGGDPHRAGKRDALDPLLWRVERPGEPSWDGASLGRGRPGWHIECSVISLHYLPAPFTVQGGGSDLVFPHHEMGAGHSWAISSRPMARHFMHTGMVGLDGEKMSKSRGNLVLVSALRTQGVDPNAIRLAIMSQHYRTDWFWSSPLLETAQQRLALWQKAADVATEGSFAPTLERLRILMAEDLNTPAALDAIDEWADSAITSASGSGDQLARSALEARLGIVLAHPGNHS